MYLETFFVFVRSFGHILRKRQRHARMGTFTDYNQTASLTTFTNIVESRQHRLSLLCKIINGLVAMPTVSNLHLRKFKINHTTHLYQRHRKTLFFPTIKSWNLLPDDASNCNDLQRNHRQVKRLRHPSYMCAENLDNFLSKLSKFPVHCRYR